MDLRTFLEKVRSAGELHDIRKEVDPVRELGAVLNACEKAGKAALFHKVKNSEIPVVGSLLSTPSRIAIALGCSEAETRARMAMATEKPVKFEVVTNAPCQEVVIDEPDLAKLPIPTHSPLDAGAFITAGVVIARDPETGTVEIVRYTSVEDVGRAVNPLIIHGQTHGGIVAGVGQALMECIVYDADGQLQTASFMDYAMPRADQFPFFTTDISEVPSASHPLGMRGAGEGGTTPSLATVANALCDALDIDHIELPATPERVWCKIKARG